jgi:hypothetical protein
MANSKANNNRPTLTLPGPEHVSIRDLIEGGVLVTGSIGAGKTSSSAKQMAHAITSALLEEKRNGVPQKSSRRKNARSV